MKAKSRLKQRVETVKKELPSVIQAESRLTSSSEGRVKPPAASPTARLPQRPAPTLRLPEKFNVRKHLTFLPTLLLSFPFYFGVYYLVTNVHPAEIRNQVFPNSYLTFHAALFLANFLLFSFFFLNSRRGVLAALFIEILVFIKIQHFVVPWYVILSLLSIFVIIEILLTGLQKLESNIAPAPIQKRKPIRSRS
jgi:hypothetical protein